MPEISRFLGIVIYMLYDDHPPPHFHAAYGEYRIAVEIHSGIVEGRFPRRALNAVLEWCLMYKENLLENWELAEKHQPLKKTPPLEYSNMMEILSADYVDGYRIRVRFSNGEGGVIDLTDALWGPVFEPLKDLARFKRFQVSDIFHTIAWDNGADFAPEYLYQKMLEQRDAADAAKPRR